MVALGTDMGMGTGTRVRVKGTRGMGGRGENHGKVLLLGQNNRSVRAGRASEQSPNVGSVGIWIILVLGGRRGVLGMIGYSAASMALSPRCQ